MKNGYLYACRNPFLVSLVGFLPSRHHVIAMNTCLESISMGRNLG